MKNIPIPLITLLFIVLFTFTLQAQDPIEALGRTPTSKETLLYKINARQARYLVDSAISFKDTSFFSSFVKEVKSDEELLRLPYGHYLKVSASGPGLLYNYIPVSPFLLYILDNSTDFLVQLKDKRSGVNLNSFQVRLDGHLVPFDLKTKAYRLPLTNYKGLLEVKDGLEQYYFKINKSSYSRSSKYLKGRRSIFKPYYRVVNVIYFLTGLQQDGYQSMLKGYAIGSIRTLTYDITDWMDERQERRYERRRGNDRAHYSVETYTFFSKPKYKPGDTVSVKALLMNKRTKRWIRKPLTARLRASNETFYLGNCIPKNGSGYYYTFQLHDSMKLRLDQRYNVELIDEDSVRYASCYFLLEHYELQKSAFTIGEVDKEHLKNKPFEIKFTARDENGLPMRDTKAEIILTAQSIAHIHPDTLFVPYQLWRHEFVIEDGSKTEAIPDSFFARADYTYHIKAIMHNAENERKEASFTINYLQEKLEIKEGLTGDSLTLSARQNDSIISQRATLKALDRYGYYLSEQEVTLPYTIAIPPHVHQYQVTTSKLNRNISMDHTDALLRCDANRNSDSIYININNPRKLDFTYQVYQRNKELQRGYGKTLQIAIPSNKRDLYYVAIQYIWAGKTKSDIYQIPLQDKVVHLQVEQPTVIYPGKEAEISITATDYQNRPVKDMSILTYAYTAKFPDVATVTLPNLSSRQNKKQVINSFTENSNFTQNKTIRLNYPYWSRHLSIDTMLNYRFIFPTQVMEKIETPMEDSITQFAPFVTDRGRLQGVHYVLVNEVPVYFGFTGYRTPYSFEADTAGYQQIKIRTPNSLVTIDSFRPRPYHKTIFSVDIRKEMYQAHVKKMPDTLTQQEINTYSNYIIKLDPNNINTDFRYLSHPSKKGVFPLNADDYSSRNYLNHYDYRNYSVINQTLGPVTQGYWEYTIPGQFAIDIELETRFTYTFNAQRVKMVNIAPSVTLIPASVVSPVPSLSDRVTTAQQLSDQYKQKPKAARRNYIYSSPQNGNAVLQIELEQLAKDTIGNDMMPLNLVLMQPGNFNFINIATGYTRQFGGLQAGNYELLIMEENGIYRRVPHIEVKADGINFMRIKQADTLSAAKINKLDSFMNQLFSRSQQVSVPTLIMGEYVKVTYIGPKETITGQLLDLNGESVIGASVKIRGTQIGTITDIDGNFSIDVPQSIRQGAKLDINALGYVPEEFEILYHHVYVLQGSPESLAEVAIYGQKVDKRSFTGSVSTVTASDIARRPVSDLARALEGAAPGVTLTGGQPGAGMDIMIRGQNSLGAAGAPLIVIDGAPYAGDLASLDPSLIGEITLLNDASSTSLYGSRGLNGVVLITTRQGATLPDHIQKALEEAAPLLPEDIMVSSLRTRFKDDAFWQPNLVTDKKGKVTFKVKFPDDLTSWNTFVYATDNQMRTGQASGNIKSFKPVSAALQATQFLVEGDTAHFIGKSVNYISDTIAVTNTYYLNDTLHTETKKDLVKYHNETLRVIAPRQDSVKIKYLLTKADGYFDGEEKTIDIFPRGVSVAQGAFVTLDSKDTTIHIPSAGNDAPLYINATASLIDIVLDEIEKVKGYQHLCNEQLASKIIASLNQQRIYDLLKKPLEEKHQAEVQKMVNLLLQRQKDNQLWGWWADGDLVIWISQHVVKALQLASEMNYNVGQLNFEKIVQPLVYRWESDASMNDLQSLKLLYTAGMKVDYEKYIRRLEQRKKQTLGQRLELIHLRQQLKLPYSTEVLTTFKQEDIFGNIFWKDTTQYIYENEVLHTLTAFQIIQADSNHAINKHKIINWLLQQRKVSGWRNIYESAQIIEALASAIDFSDTAALKPVLEFNGGIAQKVTQFPFEYKTSGKESITVHKSGAAPVYFTWYQRHWDTTDHDLGKDFILTSSFEQNGKEMTDLKAGEAVQLKVKVKVAKEAEFVMIEVPIPAGCSYQSKNRGYDGREVHREYYKNKVSIFCEKLPKGEYTYTINLLPKFTGQYTINPAKAELMYFPVFYGRGKMDKVEIK